MKRINLIIAITLCLSTTLIAQSKYEEEVMQKYVTYYNQNLPDSVFALFSAHMQKALSIERTYEFVKGSKQQFGDIVKTEFLAYNKTNANIAVYKTQFANEILDIHIAVNKQLKIDGIQLKPHIDESIAIIERNTTKMILPFHEKWFVFWGGDTEELNYHLVSQAQKNAFDFIITDAKGLSYKGSGEENQDYYCFGKELIAPCDAEVVLAVDGIKDNKPGEMNNLFPLGNTVVLKTAEGAYIYFCHFKQFSVEVKQGQKVKQGDLLGLCGNSGRSSEAHLHFHVQNTEGAANATGVKCYFKSIYANNELKKDYSPIKNDVVSNKQK